MSDTVVETPLQCGLRVENFWNRIHRHCRVRIVKEKTLMWFPFRPYVPTAVDDELDSIVRSERSRHYRVLSDA